MSFVSCWLTFSWCPLQSPVPEAFWQNRAVRCVRVRHPLSWRLVDTTRGWKRGGTPPLYCEDHTKPTHTSHSRTRDFFSRGSRLESSSQQESLCLAEQSFSHLAQHVARALVVVSFTLEHYLTFHTHSSPTFYPTVCPTFVAVHFTRRFTLRGSIECVFRPIEPHSPTGYEPEDLTREDTSKLVKPMFFHRPSMTSTCDSAESIATPPPESDLDNEQIRKMLASPLYLQEREASADRSRVYYSFRKNSVSSSSHFRDSAGNLPQCSHTQESRVKRHFPTEKAFPQDINEFKEMTKLYSGSLIRKKLRG